MVNCSPRGSKIVVLLATAIILTPHKDNLPNLGSLISVNIPTTHLLQRIDLLSVCRPSS